MRTAVRIKVGTYAGTGSAQDITGIGFRPDFVLTKGGANISCFRTRHMRGDSTAYGAGNTANFAGGITGLLNDGFRVGTDAKANAAATTYYYVAIQGIDAQNYFRVFTYLGNGSDGRQLTASDLKFLPDIVSIKGDTAQNGSVRTAAVVGDLSWHFSGTADASNEIQAFVAGGLDLGTSARVNSAGLEYFGWALKHFPGRIASGIYTGDGVDNREITGVGFQPDLVIVKDAATTSAAVYRTSDMVGDASSSLGGGNVLTNQIQAFSADGFQLGTSGTVNNVGDLFYWIALKSGSFYVPITRTAV